MQAIPKGSETAKAVGSPPVSISPALALLCLVLITAVAAVVRTLYLDSHGITLDESFSIFLGRLNFADFRQIVWHSELNMVLYYLLLRSWMHFGLSEWTIRILGVLLSTATVPVLYLLARRLFNQRTALVAAALLALHPYHLMLAQRARSYPLVILLVCLASLFFVRGLQQPAWLTWTAFAFLSAAAVYSHFFAVLVIAAQLLSLVALRASAIPWKMLLSSLALIAITLVPFLAFMIFHGKASHVDWVQELSAQQVRWLLYSLTLGKARSLVYVSLWCIAAVSAFHQSKAERWPYAFAFSWLLVPVGLVIAVSLRQPLLIERFLSICIPASVLLAAVGIVRLSEWSRILAVAILALLILYSVSAIRFYDRNPGFAEGWRESSRWILQRVQTGDAVIADGFVGLTFDYYRQNFGGNLVHFQRLDSFTAPLPVPPPGNIWVLASVRFNPNWKGAAPNSSEEAVRSFAEAHKDEYCDVSPGFEVGETRVWHFSRCAAAAPPAPTAR